MLLCKLHTRIPIESSVAVELQAGSSFMILFLGVCLQDNQIYISSVGPAARKAGLKAEDFIVMCAACAEADKEILPLTLQESASGEEKLTQLCKCFDAAHQMEQNIILFVYRLSR